jgi:hypothetical protein
MTVEKGGVPTAGFIATTDIADTYPTHLDRLGFGGMRVCQNLIDLNAITEKRRIVGMLAFSQANSTLYQLIGGLENTNWQKIYTVENGGITIQQKLKANYILLGDDANNAYQSPILIDMLADFIRLQDSTFITQTKHTYLPNSQALNKLTNGLVNVTNGILGSQTRLNYTNTDPITYPQLPFLDATWVPNPFGGESKWVGYVYEGTNTGIPKKSAVMAELFTDLLAVNYRFLTGNFVMGSGNILIKSLMPGSQWLDRLNAGIMKQTAGIISTAEAGIDYIDWANKPDEARIVVGYDENKRIAKTEVRIVDDVNPFNPAAPAGTGDNVRGINQLRCTLLQAYNVVTSDQNMIARTFLVTRKVIIADYDDGGGHRYDMGFSFDGCISSVRNIRIRMPTNITTNQNNYVWQLTNVQDGLNEVTATLGFAAILPTLAQNRYSILQAFDPADANNRIYTESDALTAQFLVMDNAKANLPNCKSLANLGNGVLAKQDNNIVIADVAPTTATYIIKTPNASLPNAQILNAIGTGLLKIAQLANGAISIAVGGQNPATDDYVRPADYQEERNARIARDGELQAEIEALQAELASLTGFVSYAVMVQFILDLIGAGFTAGYPEWLFQLKYKPLLTRFKISDTTNNFGTWPSGHVWFDSNVQDTAGHESGIRLTAWDSSTFFSESLKPLSFGILGFLNKAGYLQEQRGFVWRSEFENDANHAWYRGAKNFNLYRVVGRESSYGYTTKDLWLECEYYQLGNPKFRFHKEIDFNNVELYNVKTPTFDSSPTPKSWVLSEISNINKNIILAGHITGSGLLGTTINTSLATSIFANANIYSIQWNSVQSDGLIGRKYKTNVDSIGQDSATFIEQYEVIESLGSNIFLGREVKVWNDDSALHYIGEYAQSINKNYFYKCYAQNSNFWISFEQNVDFNSKVISNVITPTLSHHPANKDYIDNKTWPTSSITNFDSAVKAYKLSDFQAPTSNINFANYKLINLADAQNDQDGINKRTLNNALNNLVTSVTASGVLSSTGGTTPNITHNNSGVNAGTYNYINSLTVNSTGHLSSITSGTQPLTSATAGTGLTTAVTNGTLNISLSNELIGLSQLNSLGIVVRNTSSGYTTRTLIAGSGITLTNSNGVNGDITISSSGSTQAITLIGAVTGTGTNTINTILNTTQSISAGLLKFNWSGATLGENAFYSTLEDGISIPYYSHVIEAGTGSTYRRWLTSYDLGSGSSRNCIFKLGFYHSIGGHKYPFEISDYTGILTTYIRNTLDVTNQYIINVPTPTLSHHAVNKQYVDSIQTQIPNVVNINGFAQVFRSQTAYNEASFSIQCTYSGGTQSSSYNLYNNSNLYCYSLIHISDGVGLGFFALKSSTHNNIFTFNENASSVFKYYKHVDINNYNIYNLADAVNDQDAMNRRTTRAQKLNWFSVPDNYVDFNNQHIANVKDANSDQDAMNRRTTRAQKLNWFSPPDGWIDMSNRGLYNLTDGQSDGDHVTFRQLKSYSGKTGSIVTSYTIYADNGNNDWKYYQGNYLTSILTPAILPQQVGAWHGYGVVAQWDMAAGAFFAYSSKKIKNIIERDKNIIEKEAISLIEKLDIVKYEHLDDVKESKYYGIIAEELAEIDHTLIKPNMRYIPNISIIANIKHLEANTHELIFEKNLKEIAKYEIEGQKIKVNDENFDILEIKSNSIVIESNADTKQHIEQQEQVFVYGTYESCPNVNKERLFETSLAVIQNLLKRVASLEKLDIRN